MSLLGPGLRLFAALTLATLLSPQMRGEETAPVSASEAAYIAALDHFRAGEGDANRLDWLAGCEARFQRVVDDYPKTDAALAAIYCRSLCLERQDRIPAALEGLEEFFREERENVPQTPALQLRGRCLVATREREQAIEVFRQLLEKHPKSAEAPEVLYDLGLALRDLGKIADATEAWTRLRDEHAKTKAAARAQKKWSTLAPAKKRLKPIVAETDRLLLEVRGTGEQALQALAPLRKKLKELGDVVARDTEKYLLKRFPKQSAEVQSMMVEPLLAVARPKTVRTILIRFKKLDDRVKGRFLKGLRRHHLGGLDVTKAVSPLLQDRRPSDTRTQSLRLLGRADGLKAARLLAGAIHGDSSAPSSSYLTNNSTVIRAMGDLRDPEAIEFLAAQLVDGKRPAAQRTAIAAALGKIRQLESARGLLRAAQSSDDFLAAVALEGLERIVQPELISDLIDAIDKVDADRGIGLLAALRRMRDELDVEQCLALSSQRHDLSGVEAVALLAPHQTEPRIHARVVELLHDPSWQVRQAALFLLADSPSVESIDALVARLEHEKGALARRLTRELRRLTGAVLPPHHDVWAQYWKSARAEWKVRAEGNDRGRLGKNWVKHAEGHTEVAEYFGLAVDSQVVTFVLDRSESMKLMVSVPKADGTQEEMRRIDVARSELIGALERMRSHMSFNIVVFGDRFEALWKSPQRCSDAALDAAKEFLSNVELKGATNIFDSLSASLDDPRVDTVFLLSDGEPTLGRYVKPNEIAREIRRINARRQVTIHTIALGFRSALLERLAVDNLGDHIVAGGRPGPDSEAPPKE